MSAERQSLWEEEVRPYVRPTMEDVRRVAWNGLTAVGSFSGCGGSSLGLRMAGWRVPYAVEFIPAAAETYRANSPGTFVDERDVRDIKPEEILAKLGIAKGELDLFEGSPPCFLAGTPVITVDGPKAIDTLAEGNRVLTHRGRYRAIRSVSRRAYRGSLTRIKAKMGRDPLIATPEHPVLVRRRLQVPSGTYVRTSGTQLGRVDTRYRKAYAHPEWVKISEVRVGDVLLEPFVRERLSLPEVSKRMVIGQRWGKENYIEERPIELPLESRAIAWMLGLYLAEGWRRGREPNLTQPGTTRRVVHLAAVPAEIPDIEQRAIEAGLRIASSPNGELTAWRLSVGNPERRAGTGVALDFWALCGLFGDGAGGKFLPEWVFGQEPRWRAELLAGYLFGDGHSRLQDNFVTAASVSERLSRGMIRLVAPLAMVPVTLTRLYSDVQQAVICGRTVSVRPSWAWRLSPLGADSRPNNHRPSETDDSGTWIAVETVETTPEISATVYNVEVEEDESYVASGFAVHNCSGFSPAGIREAGWDRVKKYSETKQRTDDLFDEWVRLLDGLLPRAFVAENVPGMEMGNARDYAQLVTGRLSELGYGVRARVLSAANYGVPQDRERLIFVGVRTDVGPPVDPADARQDPSRPTLRAALASVDPEDPDHAPFLAASSMEPYAVGRAWEIAKGLRVEGTCLDCSKLLRPWLTGQERCACENPTEAKQYFMLTVPSLDAPCPTLTATAAQVGAASICHPTECRKFTPAECKAIGGFPADFVLTGTREQRVERCGRAVTPPLYAAIGLQLVPAGQG